MKRISLQHATKSAICDAPSCMRLLALYFSFLKESLMPAYQNACLFYKRSLLVFIMLIFSALTFGQQTDEIRKSIYFGGGSYFVDEVQATELLHWLDSIPNLIVKYEIHLISHTDPIGGKAYNEWLSEMRSLAVKEILLNHQLPENKISIKDWGLENPVYSNTTRSGMNLNRRVDVILFPIVY